MRLSAAVIDLDDTDSGGTGIDSRRGTGIDSRISLSDMESRLNNVEIQLQGRHILEDEIATWKSCAKSFEERHAHVSKELSTFKEDVEKCSSIINSIKDSLMCLICKDLLSDACVVMGCCQTLGCCQACFDDLMVPSAHIAATHFRILLCAKN